VGTLAHRLDGGLGGADQLGDLGVLELRVVARQPGDPVRLVLALGHRRIARPLGALGGFGQVELDQLQAPRGVVLAALDLFPGKLAVGGGVQTLDSNRHFAVGDALHLELVQTAELGDLLEGERGVLDQPRNAVKHRHPERP
jgi:hypothetical protein